MTAPERVAGELVEVLRKRPVRLVELDARPAIHISEIERAERARIDWTRVHLEADRRPWLVMFPNLGRWSRL